MNTWSTLRRSLTLYTNSKVVLSMDGTLFTMPYGAYIHLIVALGVVLAMTVVQYSPVPTSSEASSNTLLYFSALKHLASLLQERISHVNHLSQPVHDLWWHELGWYCLPRGVYIL